ncbi:cAMP-regulated phosphoprotein 21-like isoform X2 [Lineus longissimus]|uniref:cAMP-regulated phosphoprotein 21-like isoform X2 n=1 Tax=Lineus longissimus TaxID=88925 RepID=UPI00315CE536
MAETEKEGKCEPTLEHRPSRSRLLSKQSEVEELEEEDNSPSSETSDATVVAAGGETPVIRTPGGSPEQSPTEKKSSDSDSGPDRFNGDSEISNGKSSQPPNNKVKVLVRSHALRDDMSPPPDDHAAMVNVAVNLSPSPNTLAPCSVQLPKSSSRGRLEKDNSQSSDISQVSGTSPCLSRDSSVELYTDSTGTDLEEFIKMTLNKNPKDRVMLLRLEQELTNFIKDPKRDLHKFQSMTSYHRMIVHRVAAFFGLEHNVDQTGKAVVVNKATSTRIPDFKFREHIRDEGSQDEPKKLILKREGASFDEGKEGRSPDRQSSFDGKKQKSFEEREEEYEKARARIFCQDSTSSAGEGEVVVSLGRPSTRHSSTRSSKEDLRWGPEMRPWSSTDSSGYGTDSSSRGNVAMTKASSFGGVGGVTVLSRGDSRSTSSGRISKTDSLSSGTSSNLSSPMTRPPPIPSSPPTIPPEKHNQSTSTCPDISSKTVGTSTSPAADAPPLPFNLDQNQSVVWVASSVDTIPPGSIIINQHTGQPYFNQDGTVYRYHPPSQATPPPTSAPQPPASLPVAQPNPTTAFQPLTYPQSSPSQRQFSMESAGGSDLAPSFTNLTLSAQSSIESNPESNQVATIQTYPASPQQGQAPPGVQSQYQFNPQVSYYQSGQVPASGQQPPQYVYPVNYMQQGQVIQGSTSQEVPGQVTGPPASQMAPNGQYPSQSYNQAYPNYQVLQQVQPNSEGYQPGTYYTYQAVPQPETSQSFSTYTYPPGTGSQPGYSGGPPVYYSVPPTTGTQHMTYSNVTASQGQSSQGQFRPKTPPGQIPACSSATVMYTSGQPVTLKPGQPSSVNAAGTPQQFVPYSPFAHMASQQAQPTQRAQSPQIVYNTAVPAQAVPGGFPIVRPNMQMSMQQIQSHTTPPPSQGTLPQFVQQPPAGACQQRPSSCEMYGADSMSKDQRVVQGQGHLPGTVTPPMVQKAPSPQQLPPGVQFRAQLNPGEIRMIHQPLPHPFRPPVQPLFVRPRFVPPIPMVGKPLRKVKSQGSKDSQHMLSPQSSQDSVESALSGNNVLEVYDLPPHTKCHELEQLLDDLITQGAKIQYLTEPHIKNKPHLLVSECTVLAECPSPAAAQNILANHKNPRYKLRHRHFVLPTPSVAS